MTPLRTTGPARTAGTTLAVVLTALAFALPVFAFNLVALYVGGRPADTPLRAGTAQVTVCHRSAETLWTMYDCTAAVSWQPAGPQGSVVLRDDAVRTVWSRTDRSGTIVAISSYAWSGESGRSDNVEVVLATEDHRHLGGAIGWWVFGLVVWTVALGLLSSWIGYRWDLSKGVDTRAEWRERQARNRQQDAKRRAQAKKRRR